jgi:hypothetical protein
VSHAVCPRFADPAVNVGRNVCTAPKIDLLIVSLAAAAAEWSPSISV